MVNIKIKRAFGGKRRKVKEQKETLQPPDEEQGNQGVNNVDLHLDDGPD